MRQKRWVLVMMLVAVMLAGCQQPTPKKTWAVACESYIATGGTLLALRHAGKIGDGEWQDVKLYDAAAYAALVEWLAVIEQDLPATEAIARFRVAMTQMDTMKGEPSE